MTLQPHTLAALTRLPCLPLAEIKALPAVAAIYFAIAHGGTVLYIGRTRNLNQRWRNHHRLGQLDPAATWIAWGQVRADMNELAFAEMERLCIRQLQPKLNDMPMERKPVNDVRPFVEQHQRRWEGMSHLIADCRDVQMQIVAVEAEMQRNVAAATRWLHLYRQGLANVLAVRKRQADQGRALLDQVRRECEQFLPTVRTINR